MVKTAEGDWTQAPSPPDRILSLNENLIPDMRTRDSPIWDNFLEANTPANGSIVLCQIANCPDKEVKRGGTEKPRGRLNTTSMETHLQKHHPAENQEYLEKKAKKRSDEKKRKQSAEDKSEMEIGATPVFNLNTREKRAKYLESCGKKQPKVNAFFSSKSSSSSPGDRTPVPITSPRDEETKKTHLLILKMVILDFEPFCLVET